MALLQNNPFNILDDEVKSTSNKQEITIPTKTTKINIEISIDKELIEKGKEYINYKFLCVYCLLGRCNKRSKNELYEEQFEDNIGYYKILHVTENIRSVPIDFILNFINKNQLKTRKELDIEFKKNIKKLIKINDNYRNTADARIVCLNCLKGFDCNSRDNHKLFHLQTQVSPYSKNQWNIIKEIIKIFKQMSEQKKINNFDEKLKENWNKLLHTIIWCDLIE